MAFASPRPCCSFQDPKDAMLREFQEEIKRLKALLEVGSGSFTWVVVPGTGVLLP